jgi:hypothetical protein
MKLHVAYVILWRKHRTNLSGEEDDGRCCASAMHRPVGESTARHGTQTVMYQTDH